MSGNSCYLVRHGEAESFETDPSLSDHGKQQATQLAHILKTKNVTVSVIYHSEKRRARETAEIIANRLDLNSKLEEKAGIKPNSNPAPIVAELDTLEETVMIVSHLPFLSTLVSKLTASQNNEIRFEFKPASCICLVQQKDNWKIEWAI